MSKKNLIYKICSQSEWDDACANGIYRGSKDDARDGFIHFSAWEQVQGTYEKHFADQSELLLIAVNTEKLPENDLKWEVSRNGAKFPHLYGELNLDAVVNVEELPDP